MAGTAAYRITAILCVLFSVLVVAGIVVNSVAVGDGPDASRDGIQATLRDIDERGATYVLGWMLDMASIFVLVLLAAALYDLVRGNDRMLAVSFFAALLSGSAVFIASDVAYLVLYHLAADLAEGGAGGADAATTLEVARAITWIGDLAGVAGLTLLGLAFAALGTLVVRQSDGDPQAPLRIARWQGWLALAGGTLALFGWLGVIDDALYAIPLVGFIAVLVFLIAVAVRLFRAVE